MLVYNIVSDYDMMVLITYVCFRVSYGSGTRPLCFRCLTSQAWSPLSRAPITFMKCAGCELPTFKVRRYQGVLLALLQFFRAVADLDTAGKIIGRSISMMTIYVYVKL